MQSWPIILLRTWICKNHFSQPKESWVGLKTVALLRKTLHLQNMCPKFVVVYWLDVEERGLMENPLSVLLYLSYLFTEYDISLSNLLFKIFSFVKVKWCRWENVPFNRTIVHNILECICKHSFSYVCKRMRMLWKPTYAMQTYLCYANLLILCKPTYAMKTYLCCENLLMLWKPTYAMKTYLCCENLLMLWKHTYAFLRFLP